jgi:hypothetical protein
MKKWFYHANSNTYFLENEDFKTNDGEEVNILEYGEEIDENMVEKMHNRDCMISRFSSTDGEVTKPKISNWADIQNKLRSIYDPWDLKVKHATDEYINLPNSPEPDDMLHYIFTKKKSLFTVGELVDAFGEHRTNIIESAISWLIDKNILLGYSYQDGEFLSDWKYALTDNICINVNYNG